MQHVILSMTHVILVGVICGSYMQLYYMRLY